MGVDCVDVFGAAVGAGVAFGGALLLNRYITMPKPKSMSTTMMMTTRESPDFFGRSIGRSMPTSRKSAPHSGHHNSLTPRTL